MTDLGTLGGSGSFGFGINDSGAITGYSWIRDDSTFHAFLYSGGTMKDLGTLGGNESIGYGINASGEVTGVSDTTASIANPNVESAHAFLYSGGKMKDLGALGGTFSQGFGINSSGQVVGQFSTTDSASAHAFLYSSATGMLDLNTLLPANSGWILVEANAINDAGQITGIGIAPNGAGHAFLLSPASTADLAIRVNGARAVKFGGNLHYVLVVQNKRPHVAHNVIVTDTLPSVATRVNKGLQAAHSVIVTETMPSAAVRVTNFPRVCRLGNSNTLICKLGTMAAGSGKAIHFMLEDVTFANVGSRFSNTARVSGDVRDPHTANNTSTLTSVIK